MERDALAKLLGQYEFANFKQEEVDALMRGEKLPVTASATLLDIEQSINPAREVFPAPHFPPRENDNVE